MAVSCVNVPVVHRVDRVRILLSTFTLENSLVCLAIRRLLERHRVAERLLDLVVLLQVVILPVPVAHRPAVIRPGLQDRAALERARLLVDPQVPGRVQGPVGAADQAERVGQEVARAPWVCFSQSYYKLS